MAGDWLGVGKFRPGQHGRWERNFRGVVGVNDAMGKPAGVRWQEQVQASGAGDDLDRGARVMRLPVRVNEPGLSPFNDEPLIAKMKNFRAAEYSS
jgi:hypothetical protein